MSFQNDPQSAATESGQSPQGQRLNKPLFFDSSLENLQNLFSGLGKEKFRAQQVFKWVYEKGVTDPQQMSNLSLQFRKDFAEQFDFRLPQMASHLTSQDGTEKFLFRLFDGLTVESVLIPSDGRLTLCVSSEVGCNMACQFCYTGKQKLKRRLTTSEIVGQFYLVEKTLPAPLKITNIVFMGMGEPLDNPEAVFKSIDVLHEPFGRNFGRRKVTVSTSGLVPQIPLVTQNRVRLAVSLNAPNDEIRDQVMPINKRYPLKDLLEACREHTRESKDKVTFEYVLLKGVTDSLAHARELVHLVRHVPCKINIIPFNEHPGSGFHRPSDARVEAFHTELIHRGAHVLLRRTMGRDIYAACGQLTSVIENKPHSMDISNSKFNKKFNPRLSANIEKPTNKDLSPQPFG